MKRKHTLRSLLSMVCTIAMVLSLVPVLPAAAAADDLLFDNMESYTVGTDLYTQAPDKYTQKSPSWNAVKDAGGSATVVADPKDSNNKVIAVTTPGGDSKRYVLATVPELNGDYTLQFDYMPGDAEGNLNSGFMDVYVNQGNQHMARIASGLYNTYFNLDKTGCSNVVKNAELNMHNIWYSVRVVVTAGKYTMDIWEKGDEDTMLTCTTTKGTKAVSKAHVEFCIGPYLESQNVGNTSEPITNYIDNIRITSGVVEATDPDEVESEDTSVSGGGMVEFVDQYGIVNKEAVAVTAGMGIFSGKEGNRFDPTGKLTRAEMATVIVKMLRGNAFNADNFKGVDTFTDTADYQGGWAEGYINACVEMGIVKGYGDGTFKPGNNVNTAEALTMIINALKVDAGEGEWPTTIMAKAQEMKLYGDLSPKPNTYDVLTRDELAVLVYEGMNFSPSGSTGWMIPDYDVVFESYADAKKANGGSITGITEVKGKDALVSKVYEMKIAEGFIVENQETSDDKFTTIMPVGSNTGIPFNMNTRLDQIGHYVTVYYREEYKTEKDCGVVYNYVDETEAITVEKAVTTSKEYKETFFANTKLAANVARFNNNYTFNSFGANTGATYTAGSAAAVGTYFVRDGEIVAYMAPVPVYAAKVRAVNNISGSETITLSYPSTPISNTKDEDYVREYEDIAKDDYVTYTVVGDVVGGTNAIYVLTKADVAKGIVTKSATNKDGDNVITVGGAEYVQFAKSNTNEQNMITEFQQVSGAHKQTKPFDSSLLGTDSYEVYVTENGKYIAYKAVESGVNMEQTAFILGESVITGKDNYGNAVRKTYARGVDLNGNEVMLLLKVEKNGEIWSDGTYAPSSAAKDTISDPSYTAALAGNKFYTYDLSTDSDARKEDIYKLTAYPAKYDKDNGDLIYTGTRTFGNNGTYSFTNFNNITEHPGVLTYYHSGTKYMLLEGTVDQQEPLTGTMKTSWSTSTNNTGATMYHYYLLSRDANNNQMLDVAIVVVSQNAAAASSGQVVYVSEANRTPAGLSADGYVYDVYDYSTGAKKQITVDKNDPKLGTDGVFTKAGYWKILPDELDAKLSVLVNEIKDSPNFSYSTSNSSSNDGLYFENVLHNQQFVALMNDELTTSGATSMDRGKKASNAMVVDVRTEDQIEADGIGKIKNLDRIQALSLDNPEIQVTFDLCYSTSKGALWTVFITDVSYTSVGKAEFSKSGSTYYLDGRTVADNVAITDLSGRLSGATTSAKLDSLISQSNTGTVNVTYKMDNGKVVAITVEAIAFAGELFVEEFNDPTYDIASGNASFGPYDNGVYGTYTYNVVNEDGSSVLKTTAKDVDGNYTRVWLGSKQKLPAGSYVLETRFKGNTAGYISTILRLPEVHVPKYGTAGATTGASNTDYELRTSANRIFLVVNKLGADNRIGSESSEAYLYDANGAQFAFAGNTWYTVRVTVDAEAGTILTELFDGTNPNLDLDNATPLATRILYGATVAESTVTIDNYSTKVKDQSVRETCWDYIKAYEKPASAVTTYSVTATSTSTALIDTVKTAAAGDTVTVKTTIKPGYKLTGIVVEDAQGNPVSVVDGKFTMPAGNVTVTATTALLVESTVTITENAAVTITVTDAEGNPVASGTKFLEGTVLTVEAAVVDDINTALDAIYANGTPITGDTYTVTDQDVEITAAARDHKFYTLSAGTCVNGAVAFTHDGVEGTGANAGKVREGATVTVTAAATGVREGFELDSVYVNGSKITGTTFVIGEDTTVNDIAVVTAEFKPTNADYFESFTTYTDGAAFTTGSSYTVAGTPTIYQQYPDKNNYAPTTDVTNGTTVLTAKAIAYNNNCLYINYRHEGSYVFETRFMSVDDQWVNIQNTGVTTTKKGAAESVTTQANYMIYIGQAQGIKLYRAASAGGSDSTLVSTTNYKNKYLGTFITFRMTVNKTANTVLTELFDEDMNLITSFTLDSTTTKQMTIGDNGNIGFDVRSKNGTTDPGTILIDYVMVQGF